MAYLVVCKKGIKTHNGWLKGNKSDTVEELLKTGEYMNNGKLDSSVNAAIVYLGSTVGAKKALKAKEGDNLEIDSECCISAVLESNNKEDQKAGQADLKSDDNVVCVVDLK